MAVSPHVHTKQKVRDARCSRSPSTFSLVFFNVNSTIFWLTKMPSRFCSFLTQHCTSKSTGRRVPLTQFALQILRTEFAHEYSH